MIARVGWFMCMYVCVERGREMDRSLDVQVVGA